MLDKERILSKIDELDAYLNELSQIMPQNFKEYQKTEKKRSCERLLQLCIEVTIDICRLFVVGLKLGLPSEENDLFNKMEQRKIISPNKASLLKEMRGFRNILVHEYTTVNDEIVYNTVKMRLEDFKSFKKEILDALSVWIKNSNNKKNKAE